MGDPKEKVNRLKDQIRQVPDGEIKDLMNSIVDHMVEAASEAIEAESRYCSICLKTYVDCDCAEER